MPKYSQVNVLKDICVKCGNLYDAKIKKSCHEYSQNNRK